MLHPIREILYLTAGILGTLVAALLLFIAVLDQMGRASHYLEDVTRLRAEGAIQEATRRALAGLLFPLFPINPEMARVSLSLSGRDRALLEHLSDFLDGGTSEFRAVSEEMRVTLLAFDDMAAKRLDPSTAGTMSPDERRGWLDLRMHWARLRRSLAEQTRARSEKPLGCGRVIR